MDEQCQRSVVMSGCLRRMPCQPLDLDVCRRASHRLSSRWQVQLVQLRGSLGWHQLSDPLPGALRRPSDGMRMHANLGHDRRRLAGNVSQQQLQRDQSNAAAWQV